MSSLGFYGYQPDNAFKRLRERGAVKASASYSGGNDEGDIWQLRLELADGSTVNADRDWDNEDSPATKLWDAIEEAVYDRHSFNGHPYISGTMVFDVATHKVTDDWEEDH